jgi:ParB-like chromosome segregation protein Spo0J
MSASGKYQEFDPLSPEEFAALERSILDRGVQVAIVLDEHGNVLDGHHRLAICKKHKITDYPTTVKAGLSEEEKRNYAQSLNMARRSLSREQVQKQIRNRLKRNPEHSDRLIAQALGVDHKTIGRVRAEMELSGEVPQVERKIGLNGMQYKASTKLKLADAVGGAVPQRLERVFGSRAEHASLANIVADVKRRVGELSKHSALYSQLEALRRHLASAEAIIRQSSPHAIHAPCKGNGCEACGGKGYVTCGEIPQRRD